MQVSSYLKLANQSRVFLVSSLVYGYGIVLAGGFFMGLSDLVVLAANSGMDQYSTMWQFSIHLNFQALMLHFVG